MRRSLVLIVVLVALSHPVAAWADQSGCAYFCGTSVSSAVDGFRVQQDVRLPATGASDADSGSAGPAREAGPLFEYDYRSTCEVPGGTGDCGGETVQCAARGARSVFVAQRQVAPTAGAWSLQPGSVCLTPAQQLAYSPAQLQAFVDDYFQRLPLPLPALDLQPGDKGVVNLPQIASSQAPGQTTFTVTQAPFPTVTITATVGWRWSWGDGSTTTTSWPGRAYDGTDPAKAPGHYIDHTYTAPTPGVTVGVTAVWTGSWSIAGQAPQPIAGAVERTATRTLPVAEYGATLTGN